jgi:hypothetical protein
MQNFPGTRFFKVFLFLPALIWLSACDIGPLPPPAPTMDARVVDDITYVIFSPQQAEAAQVEMWASAGENFEGYWMPSGKDFLTMEAQLGPYLQAHADQFFAHPTVWAQLDEYYRQYAGLTVDGTPLIYGNFFCGEAQMDWLTEWVIVLDGGDCYFQVLYNVKDGTFIRLQVNGEA